MQQLDVCLLILKKWDVKQQEEHLMSYFQNNRDGILLYSGHDVHTFNSTFKVLLGFESNSTELPPLVLDSKVFQFNDHTALWSLRQVLDDLPKTQIINCRLKQGDRE